MRRVIKPLSYIAVIFASTLSNLIFANTQVIHAGELLANPNDKPLVKQTIIIQNNKIVDVKAGFVDPKTVADDAELIDLSKSFVMPGLFDMHVHLQGELGPDNDSESLRMSASDKLVASIHFANKTLLAGFTTVRDLGGSAEEIFALRDGVEKGYIDGPHIIASGPSVSVTGGHGDVDGMSPDILKIRTVETICDGPFDCRRATRQAIKYGADIIKITSTGGVLSDTDTGTGQQMTDDELKEVVDTAHALGRKVASHAHAAAGINAALRAGVDSIEHGSYVDNESVALFKESGAYHVPTLLAGYTVANMARSSDFMSPAIKAKAIRVGTDMVDSFKLSYKAGVNIAFGTDSGVSKHGVNAQEAILMYQAGMPAREIIKSATVNAADLADLSATHGTIGKGKVADIIALDSSPLENIEELLDVDFVMKSGKIVKQ
ncbi:MAG: amidohydrolase family protein [Gammaproteobacteria bacterium]|nr:amidohydrolase family protein [Gammaproteobacteria bacterium]